MVCHYHVLLIISFPCTFRSACQFETRCPISLILIPLWLHGNQSLLEVSRNISQVSRTFLASFAQLLWEPVSLHLSVDLHLLQEMFLEKFRRCLILLSYLAPYALIPKPLPWPFPLKWCICGPQQPSRPQWVLGGGRSMVSANQNCFVIMFSVQGKPFHNRRSCHPQEWTPCLFASSVSSAHPGLLPERILRAHSTWRTAPPSICCTAGEHTAP